MNHGRVIFVVITAALVLLVALSWNAFVEHLVDRIFGEVERIWGELLYAVVVTLIAIGLIVLFAYLFGVKENVVERTLIGTSGAGMLY